MGQLNLEPRQSAERESLVLKEERMSVTSGKKKASVRKETIAVSVTIHKIVRKNQNTLPPHLPCQPFHEAEVCRRREVSEAKVTMDPFFDNRVDVIWRVPARECLEYWHPPECQLKKKKRVVSQETRVCFLITRLMNNQMKGRTKAASQKEGKVKTKALWQSVKSVSQLGCASQDSDALDSQGTKESRGNPMQKVLEPILWVRFTKSTLRHASIRDKKGPSLGKIQVKPRHQRSPYAIKFEDRSHEETEWQERCAQSKVGSYQKYMQAQSERQGYILLACKVGAPGCVNKRAGGNRVCSWFRSEYACGE